MTTTLVSDLPVNSGETEERTIPNGLSEESEIHLPEDIQLDGETGSTELETEFNENFVLDAQITECEEFERQITACEQLDGELIIGDKLENVKFDLEQDNFEIEGKNGYEVNSESDEGTSFYECAVCNQSFETRPELDTHVKLHLKVPALLLNRVKVPKPVPSRRLAKKHIRPYRNFISQVIEPENTNGSENNYPAVPKIRILLPQQLSDQVDAENARCRSTESQRSDNSHDKLTESCASGSPISRGTPNMVELQTLPSESQSPAFPGPSPGQPDVSLSQQADHTNFWHHDDSHSTDSILPMHHRESGEKEAERHDSLLQNFLNDSAESVVSSKDSGMIIPNNETEFISLERLAGPQCGVCGERCIDQRTLEIHYKATGHFPASSSSCNTLVPYSGQPQPSPNLAVANPLDSLSNLPMQQLAQQVNRLQQQGQVHQQNVLINIQQFGQPPPYGGMPPSEMGPPHMHHMPHTPHYGPQQPPPHHMYMPHSQYHPPPPPPPHHMYYGGGAMYSPHPPPQHPPQPPQPQQSQVPVGQPQPQFRHEPGSMMPPRMPPPRMQQMRPPNPHQQQPRPQMPARGPPSMGQRAPVRGMPPRAMMQGRGASTATQQQRQLLHQQQQQKRAAVQQQHEQIKKKRLDVLIPDTNDDADCHVISMQKCNDGLPIIKNVQGAATSAGEPVDPVVHLTDSITLSVRNPKEAPAPVIQQKKNDAKAVANILATRGITVTPATKSAKESPPGTTKNAAPVAINLNSAVSIIPTAKNQPQQLTPGPKSPVEKVTKTATVDLTEDEPGTGERKQTTPGGKRALPYQCDLCPAQYPSMRTLVIHRRQYHKAGPQSELGVPIVDLSQPSSLNKLAALGIHSYIPLPQMGPGNNGTFALPIVSVNAARNPNLTNLYALGSNAVLTLGPLHHISNLNNANKQ